MSVSYHRSPCPGRIFEDLGVGFSLGCFGGSLIYFFKGAWNSPRRSKIRGGLVHVRNRAPFLGGSFAMWGGCFSSFDCLMIWYRQKDDPWNAIVSGFLTGGILAVRGGANLAFKNALIGGVILGLIEGISIIMQSVMTRRQFMMMEEMQKREIERMRLAANQNKNPWEVSFDEKESGGMGGYDSGSSGSGKSYSF